MINTLSTFRGICLLLVYTSTVSLHAAASETLSSAPIYETLWGNSLKAYCHEKQIFRERITYVDYASLMGSQTFQVIHQLLRLQHPNELISKEDKLSFWINVYNFTVIKLIVDHYPIPSLEDLNTKTLPIWDNKVITVGNMPYSLSDIRDNVLRSQGDPRIHFALVDGAKSSPDLLPKPFTASKLDTQLTYQQNRFLNNAKKGLRFNHTSKQIYLSLLFKHFQSDFGSLEDIRTLASGYTDRDISNYSITYFAFDRALNDVP